MEQHRANPTCASCHARMDPIGFGFENYDGVGKWRDKDGDYPVDAAGKLLSGEDFRDASELKRILADTKRDEFLQCLASKMLTFALGRGMEYYDRPSIDGIVKNLAQNKYQFAAVSYTHLTLPTSDL